MQERAVHFKILGKDANAFMTHYTPPELICNLLPVGIFLEPLRCGVPFSKFRHTFNHRLIEGTHLSPQYHDLVFVIFSLQDQVQCIEILFENLRLSH
jgi:hypothetical protein